MIDPQTLPLLRDLGMGFAALILFSVGFYRLLSFLLKDRDGWRETYKNTHDLAQTALEQQDTLRKALERNTEVLQTSLARNDDVIEKSTSLMEIWSTDTKLRLERIEAYATSNHMMLQQIMTAIGDGNATSWDDISRSG